MPATLPIPLSHSRLEKARCLFQFFWLFVVDKERRVVEPKSVPAMMGGLFHDIADQYFKRAALNPARAQHAIVDHDLMATVFDEMWASRDKEYAALGEEYREELRGLCIGFVAQAPVGPEFVGSEIRLAFNQEWQSCDWMDPEVRYRMVIDRVDIDGRTVRVRDWKTSWKADTQEQVDRDPQIQGYALGMSLMLPEAEIFEIGLVFPRRRVERFVTINKADIDKARDRILRESARIERARAEKRWEAIPGEQCDFCPVFDRCPAKETAKNFRPPAAIEDAKALLGQRALLKKGLYTVDALLKAWVKHYGAVFNEGMVAEFRRTATTRYLTDELRESLTKLGVDPWLLVKWDRRALAKIAKESGEIDDAIDMCSEEGTASTKWFVGKAGDEPYDPEGDE